LSKLFRVQHSEHGHGLTPKPEIRRAVPLPQFHLTSTKERAALRRLRLNWGDKSEQARFRRFVLASLHFIEAAVEEGLSRNSGSYKPSQLIRVLKRRAEQVRRFAARLEKRLPVPRLLLPPPPARALRLYAEGLEAYARSLAEPASGPRKVVPLSSLRGTPNATPVDLPVPSFSLAGLPQKRKARSETERIYDLMKFVREQTGRPHWNDLVILLERPCKDHGMSKDRLRSTWKYNRPKGPSRRHHVVPRRRPRPVPA
jgi:hypothetical protein